MLVLQHLMLQFDSRVYLIHADNLSETVNEDIH